jgi:hypothetical protein
MQRFWDDFIQISAMMVGVKRYLWFLLMLTALAAGCTSLRDSRRLIEWGWDTPKLQQFGAFLAQAQTLPFDGAIVDVESPLDERGLSWTLFGSQPVDQSVLDDLAAQYADLPWGRLTDNFLRLTVHPADLDWFEDWQVINRNAEAWARFARELGFVGIMLDVEQYSEAHLFEYSQQPQADTISFDASGITIMFTYALTVDFSAPTERYGLLVPFVEGMISAAAPSTTLIDGYEHSYIYKDEGQFGWGRNRILTVTPRYGGSVFEHPMRVGFGLWIDPVCGAGGLPPEGCGFTPGEFTTALTGALKHSDRYVWVYSEDINWYTGQGIPPLWLDTLSAFRR